jgi:phosphatidylglycerophosphate synthase
MAKEKFGGAGEKYQGFTAKAEEWFVHKVTPYVPKFIETYHLTYSTILWSVLIVVSGFLAMQNIQWLWVAAVCVFLQYVTDLLDGAVGRYRKTGLIKWGFYMDHFLDYIFLCSVLISYWFTLPDKYNLYLFFLLAIFGAFMVDAYLYFAATNKFKITHLKFGPTEMRAVFIFVYILNIYADRIFLSALLPYLFVFATLILIGGVYKNQQRVWKLDMKIKKESLGSSAGSEPSGKLGTKQEEN